MAFYVRMKIDDIDTDSRYVLSWDSISNLISLLDLHVGPSDVFGISYTETSAKAGHFGNSKHLPTRFHAWDFDSTLLRLLHLAGYVTVCSRDKK